MKGFLQRILQEIMKKLILGTSGAWSMRRASHRPIDTATQHYIEDCRILGSYDNCVTVAVVLTHCIYWNMRFQFNMQFN